LSTPSGVERASRSSAAARWRVSHNALANGRALSRSLGHVVAPDGELHVDHGALRSDGEPRRLSAIRPEEGHS